MEKYFIKDLRKEASQNKKWKPGYNFTAPSGWVNDPNGLIYFKGWYHLFYQHNPGSAAWASMHWGHAVSHDMMHWEDLPIALYPDMPYDDDEAGGVFSGSAAEMDGKLYLFYTGSYHDNGKKRQVQCMAVSEDGVNFKKYEGNPIIKKPPEGCSLEDFRDPQLLKEGDWWYMVTGGIYEACETGPESRVFLFRSADLYNWEFRGYILRSINGNIGTMLECPNLFKLGDKWVIISAPMHHPNFNKALYCVGSMDFENACFTVEKSGNLDYGYDYYAPQTLLDEKGNRILIAWQDEWTWMPWFDGNRVSQQEGWSGSLSFPRVATLDEDNNIHLNPIAGLEKLKYDNFEMKDVEISTKKMYLTPADPYCYEIAMKLKSADVVSQYVQVGVLGEGDKAVKIEFDFITGILAVDRNNSDNYKSGRVSCVLGEGVKELDLQILVDRSIVTVFADNGRYNITCNVYPEASQKQCWIKTPYKTAKIEKLSVAAIKNIW